MRFDQLVREMARPPRTREAALKRTLVLPPNATEARKWINEFWQEFLKDNPGATKCSGCKPPEAPFDQVVEVSSAGEGKSFRMWLDWHSSVTFKIGPGMAYTVIATTTDTPGTYRFDFVLLGQKKAVVDALRTQVSNYVSSEQSKIKSSLSKEEQAEFERIGVSRAPVAHSERTGFRQDDKLIGRLVLDRIPLPHLPQRAKEIADITKGVGDIIIDTIGTTVKS